MGDPSGFYERTSKYLRDLGLDVSDKVVLIGGIGTIGSRLARNLARFDFKKIVLVDFDYVGPENVGYQCYHTEEIGNEKVKALSSRLNKYHPWTHVEGVFMEVFTPSSLVSLESLKKLEALVKESDVVVTCFDTLPPRATMLLLAYRNNKKYVDTGIGVSRGYVKVLKEGYCPICSKVWEEKVTYYTNPNLAEVVAAIAAQAVLYLANDRGWPSEIHVNMDDPYKMIMSSEVRNEGCPLCSDEVKELSINEIPKYLVKKVY